MRFGKSDFCSWKRGIEKEWLLTNGIGGFASSTITGGNSRRYHGLLTASLKPPVDRRLVISQLHESVEIGQKKYNIHSFSTGDFIMEGYLHLQSFEKSPLPEYVYTIGALYIKKTILLVHGENTVAVVYKVRTGPEAASLRLTPLVNFRDYHGNSSKQYMHFTQEAGKDRTTVHPAGTDVSIYLICNESCFTQYESCWFENMFYDAEDERGLYAKEDHYIPGSFDIEIAPHSSKTITFIGTIEKDRAVREPYEDGTVLIRKEEERLAALVRRAGYEDEFADALVRAADHFIAYRRSTDSMTILAGFPWFTDWGRDSMISLCGLTLCTKRYNDAAQILTAYSRYVKNGLLPNMFPDDGGDPGYNTVDAALWYFEAISKYVEYTGDLKLVKDQLFDSMLQIYKGYRYGTLNNIRMDRDGLIASGGGDTQLTWMDAKTGNTVFTPRGGKTVEINALWYNALKVLEKFSGLLGKNKEEYAELAALVRVSFCKVFWNNSGGCLYDVVTDTFSDDSVRPNQIIAVSLTYPVLDGRRAELVVEKVWNELYTPYGIRTLSPSSRDYRGHYTGDQYSRDSAYHQGTAWPWLTGHFITAFKRTLGRQPIYSDTAESFIEPFIDHLNNACLGSISEIFDGDEPHAPKGCFAQAWSVAEILRAYSEDILSRGGSANVFDAKESNRRGV